MPYCIAKFCKKSEKDNTIPGKRIHFFHLPKKPSIRTQWLAKCGRPVEIGKNKEARVCSVHFGREDFKILMPYENGFSKRLFLNDDAIPSKFPNDLVGEESDPNAHKTMPTGRSMRFESRKRKKKMYQDNPSKQVKESYYRSVFNSPEFNHLSFHKPKKDLCCVSYYNGTQQEKDEKRAEYEAHIARRDRVLEVKQELKDLAKSDENVATASFDLEQVLLCPRLNVSSLFYRRKLATYNLTVYDMGTRDVSCYMWHEGAGGRGCNEIATSIHLYLKSLSASIKRVIFFSDTCSAQNRNQFFSAMCLNAVRSLPIECIDHVYMESGHSHMECDTAHSTIETALKTQEVYSPADYYSIVTMARRKQPFKVIVLDTDDFLDFKALNKSIIRNKKKDVDDNTVHWIKMKWMRYQKDSPDSIMFKYDYDDEFIEMKVNHGVRGRPSIPCKVLVPLFTDSPCITQAKYDDLEFLCKSLAIPRFYHEFYKGLKANKNARDALPTPDVTEEEVENEIE